MKKIQKPHQLMKFIISLLVIFFSFISCEKEESIHIPSDTEQTVFMYFPWSTNLTSYFYKNISDFESAISQNLLKKERVIVFISTSPTEASLFELAYEKGQNIRKPLKQYTNPAFTKAEGITSILNDVQSFAPAHRYSMIIGCHGMGWIPVPNEKVRSDFQINKKHWEYENVPITRYFGGLSSEYQTDITSLAQGISNAGIKMEYILFDDCYMSSVEVAYTLKNVTGHLIASTSEIMAYGMPYAQIAQYLVGKVDYENICNEFYSFYSNFEVPCGTIGVTDCSELDNLASIMKEINSMYTLDSSLLNSLQPLDGYSPVLFFDYGDYVSKLCKTPDLLNQFNEQLTKAVPFKRNTNFYYTMSRGMIEIKTFSGITISDPSVNPDAHQKEKTAWYKATH